MKVAIVMADGVTQIMFTPENESDKQAIKYFSPEHDITMEVKPGTFYEGFRDNQARSYNVALCQGGYLRAYENSDSLMLVLKPKAKPEEK